MRKSTTQPTTRVEVWALSEDSQNGGTNLTIFHEKKAYTDALRRILKRECKGERGQIYQNIRQRLKDGADVEEVFSDALDDGVLTGSSLIDTYITAHSVITVDQSNLHARPIKNRSGSARLQGW